MNREASNRLVSRELRDLVTTAKCVFTFLVIKRDSEVLHILCDRFQELLVFRFLEVGGTVKLV